MFGYIVVNKPELKFKEYDVYRAYYCGLCHALKNRHGYKGQVALNNDLTFVAILLCSLYEAEVEKFDSRCIIHPVKKHEYYKHEILDYAADMTIALAYYKSEDDWLDDHNQTKRLYRQWLKSSFYKVKKLYGSKMELMKTCLDEIHVLEKQQCDNLDKVSGLFGKIMGEICVYKDDEWKDELYEFGFYLGKFIYLYDAYDDLDDDIKNHSYNPFIYKKDRKDFEEYCFNVLQMMMASAANSFECLPIIENYELLKNIIYSGVWSKYEYKKQKGMERG